MCCVGSCTSAGGDGALERGRRGGGQWPVAGRVDRQVPVPASEHAADLSRLGALVADTGWPWPECRTSVGHDVAKHCEGVQQLDDVGVVEARLQSLVPR